jgi:hypothetical protein
MLLQARGGSVGTNGNTVYTAVPDCRRPAKPVYRIRLKANLSGHAERNGVEMNLHVIPAGGKTNSTSGLLLSSSDLFDENYRFTSRWVSAGRASPGLAVAKSLLVGRLAMLGAPMLLAMPCRHSAKRRVRGASWGVRFVQSGRRHAEGYRFLR